VLSTAGESLSRICGLSRSQWAGAKWSNWATSGGINLNKASAFLTMRSVSEAASRASLVTSFGRQRLVRPNCIRQVELLDRRGHNELHGLFDRAP
jgi:hypothetical protein